MAQTKAKERGGQGRATYELAVDISTDSDGATDRLHIRLLHEDFSSL